MLLKQVRASLTPADMERELGRYVIGQDAAKHALTNAYWRNTQLRKSKKKGVSPKRYLPQANVLIAAPSGSGKTFLLDMFCELFDIPHVSFPATSLSAEGYVGCKPGDIVEALLVNARGNKQAAMRGLIHLDEIDKIKATPREGDVGGIAVQESLLTFLEGAPVVLKRYGQNSKCDEQVDLSGVTWVGTGAFEGLSRQANEQWVNEEALVSFGFMRQFIGRFPIRVWMEKLGENELRRILTESEASAAKRLINSFRDWKGTDLEFEAGAIDAIVRIAMQKGTGARALNEVVQTVLSHVTELLPVRALGVKSYVVETKTVTERKPPRKVLGVSSCTPLDLPDVEEESPEEPPRKTEPVVQEKPPSPPAEPPKPCPAAPPVPPPRQPQRRRWLIGGAVVAALLLVGVSLYALFGPETPGRGSRSTGTGGRKAPDLIEKLRSESPESRERAPSAGWFARGGSWGH